VISKKPTYLVERNSGESKAVVLQLRCRTFVLFAGFMVSMKLRRKH